MVPSNTRTAGYQRWQKLGFLHWRVAADVLQQLIPDCLTIESFDGSAWLGLVPFSMERIRPWWFPPVPGISWFLETNVRTYVVDERGIRGVWFFSLDANKQLAVSVARSFWHLPYKMATMKLSERPLPDGTLQINYEGERIDNPAASYSVSLGLKLRDAGVPATPGSLDHFLVERYILFALNGKGRLMTGEVHHEPYQIRPIHHCRVVQSLTTAMGCDNLPEVPDHVVFSDGVNVRVSPLTIV